MFILVIQNGTQQFPWSSNTRYTKTFKCITFFFSPDFDMASKMKFCNAWLEQDLQKMAWTCASSARYKLHMPTLAADSNLLKGHESSMHHLLQREAAAWWGLRSPLNLVRSASHGYKNWTFRIPCWTLHALIDLLKSIFSCHALQKCS